MHLWPGFCSCLVLLLLAAPLAGQPAQVRIVGRVIADSDAEMGLGSAVVTLMRHTGQVVQRVETDEGGSFAFTTRSLPAIRLHVRRVGYRSTTTPLLRLDGRRFFQLEVRLDPEAILLAPLEVIAWSGIDRSPLLDNFRRRVRSGPGLYITRDQIDERRPAFVSEMLRTLPGVELNSEGRGSRPKITMGRTAAQTCETQIFIDGLLVNRGLNDVRLDDVVSPESVEGIEVYRGLSTVPPEFLNPQARCGVIAVWTRRGGRAPLF
jgi:hypothetical protein